MREERGEERVGRCGWCVAKRGGTVLYCYCALLTVGVDRCYDTRKVNAKKKQAKYFKGGEEEGRRFGPRLLVEQGGGDNTAAATCCCTGTSYELWSLVRVRYCTRMYVLVSSQ